MSFVHFAYVAALRPAREIILFAFFLFAFTHSLCDAAGPATNPTFRRYELGPLAIKEFCGKVGDRHALTAYTATRIICEFKYDTRIQDQEVVVTLTSLDTYAVFYPHDSWWGDNANPRLLDHEQGHFDIAETALSEKTLRNALTTNHTNCTNSVSRWMSYGIRAIRVFRGSFVV